jgi:hypothetical protein
MSNITGAAVEHTHTAAARLGWVESVTTIICVLTLKTLPGSSSVFVSHATARDGCDLPREISLQPHAAGKTQSTVITSRHPFGLVVGFVGRIIKKY